MSWIRRKKLRKATERELVLARAKIASRRNISLLAGIIVLSMSLVDGPNTTIVVVTMVILIAAAAQHLNIRLIDDELTSRLAPLEENQ